MGRYLGLLLIAVSAGCATLVPDKETGIPVTIGSGDDQAAETGIPITIRNGDDQAAELEVSLYNAVTGMEQTVMEPTELSPGETTTIRVEPTRDRDDAYQVMINGFVAVSSDFLGCGDDLEPPLPEELLVVVLPNGEPDACSNWPGSP